MFRHSLFMFLDHQVSRYQNKTKKSEEKFPLKRLPQKTIRKNCLGLGNPPMIIDNYIFWILLPIFCQFSKTIFRHFSQILRQQYTVSFLKNIFWSFWNLGFGMCRKFPWFWDPDIQSVLSKHFFLVFDFRIRDV